MDLVFQNDGHIYKSLSDPDKKWLSVTSIIEHFKEPFDAQKVAELVSKKKTSKWYGLKPEEIIALWDKEKNRSTTLGSWYHNGREEDTNACNTIRREGIDLQIFPSLEQDGVKYAPDQTLVPGIYPEHFMYLNSAKICGQADRVEVVADRVDIIDYKSNKEIKTEGFTDRNGVTKKMYPPLNHLDDCNYIHYSIQLSFYMYMILKHNPNLKPGKMILQHVTFELAGKDDYGFPIVAVDLEGNPIVDKIQEYPVKYLEKEVIKIISKIKANPKKYMK